MVLTAGTAEFLRPPELSRRAEFRGRGWPVPAPGLP